MKNHLYRYALLIAVILIVGQATAHSFLISADPASESVLDEQPADITLVMNEAVEVRFSIFKVYPLPGVAGLGRQELAQAARELMDMVIGKRDDQQARADAGLITEAATTDTIHIALKEDLPAGSYLVMWRALSIDTHTTQDFLIFTLQPGPEPSSGEGAATD